MFVLGTAGHVDHGKSALVKALSGIDPDRLPEEKEREMTLDLGFAWFRLPSGREVSVIDVPGHERFVHNMLAGIGGIDLALLVVAADEGVMPQTREHLAILHLLGIPRGIVAITKADLVDDDWLEMVASDVSSLLTGTSLEGAPTIPVSSRDGRGLPRLLEAIDRALDQTPPRKDLGRPRLPIDRVFTVAGFGTVVTGTLMDGSLLQGQEVEVVPGGLRSRIRSLQRHRQKVEQVGPGTRIALNLADVSTQKLYRGQVVTSPGWLKPTQVLDARLQLLEAAQPLRHSATVSLHAWASEALARIRLLKGNTLRPGQASWAQLRLNQPLALVKGDRFILRTSANTVGGGEVLDPHPSRHLRSSATALERLAAVSGLDKAEEVMASALEKVGLGPVELLAQEGNLSLEEGLKAAQILASQGRAVSLGNKGLLPRTVLLSLTLWEKTVATVKAGLAAYHRQFPLRRGAPREEVRGRLGVPASVLPLLWERLLEERVLVEEGNRVRLPEHQVRLDPQQQRAIAAFLSALEAEPFSPPGDLSLEPQLLNLLLEEGKVVKLSEKVYFSATPYSRMVALVTEHMKKNGKITVAQVRDLLGTSRKYALALMEHLDQQKVTRRVGDERVLRREHD